MEALFWIIVGAFVVVELYTGRRLWNLEQQVMHLSGECDCEDDQWTEDKL